MATAKAAIKIAGENSATTETVEERRARQPKIVTRLFSATKQGDRNMLDGELNAWLRSIQGKLEVKEIRTLLSSDAEFHCTLIFVIAHEIE